MSAFAQEQNRTQNRHSVSPVRPDHAKSRHAPAWNPFLTQQSALGNQALQRLLRTKAIQAKLTVNQPGDKYEQEADRVADQVMRMPEQITPAGRLPLLPGQCSAIQQLGPECDRGRQRRQNTEFVRYEGEPAGGPGMIPRIESTIGIKKSGGQPLPLSELRYFEPRFGRDLGDVRIHIDADSANFAQLINARAYSVGSDIAFAPGQFQLAATAGRRLLAHELTHFIQKSDRRISTELVQRKDNTEQSEKIPITMTRAFDSVTAYAHKRLEEPPSNSKVIFAPEVYNFVSVSSGPFYEAVSSSEGAWVRLDVDMGFVFWLRATGPGAPITDVRVDETTYSTWANLRSSRRGSGGDISVELSDAPDAETAQRRAFLWILKNRQLIVAAERKFGIDRRSVAGAIVWEAVFNPHSSTYFGVARFRGPGKLHTREERYSLEPGTTVIEEVEQLGILQPQTPQERVELIKSAEGAITYISAVMKAHADEGKNAGYNLYCDPAILTTLYQTRTIADTRSLFSQKKAPATLTPNEEDPNLPDIKLMGAWTRDNLSWLESAVGKPAISECLQPKGY